MRNPCVAHRGWSGRAPENTLAAIELALSEPYVSMIEIDVQLSKDHIPVVIHDYKLNRTTNGKGLVKDHTAAELAKLDAGSWYSRQYAGERIPTLEQVLQAAAGKCRLNIELKTDGIRYPSIVDAALELVQAYHMEHAVVFTSFHEGSLYRARKLSKEVSIGYITDRWRSTLLQELEELECHFLSIHYAGLSKERMALLNSTAIETMAWTLNNARAIRKMMDIDPAILICTDYPDRYREAHQERSEA